MDCEVMRIFTQILCSARVRPNLIYLESDNLNPNLAPSSVSPEIQIGNYLFIAVSGGNEAAVREVRRCHDIQCTVSQSMLIYPVSQSRLKYTVS